jgi:hypothetical protein
MTAARPAADGTTAARPAADDAPARPAPRIGFRQCDPRFPFLWRAAAQPAARWHGAGEGPAHYFADTPTGAWAELLRHEEVTDPADLPGIRRALWAVELPGTALPAPAWPSAVLSGGESSYPACQAEARRLRAAGHAGLEAPAAALQPGAARGHDVGPAGLQPGAQARDGRVWVFFGPLQATGWLAVQDGAPPAGVLPLVRPLAPEPPSAPPSAPPPAAESSPPRRRRGPAGPPHR